MTYAPAAPEFERLPWLTDDRKPASRRGLTPLVIWSTAAALLVAGSSYWLGMTSPSEGLEASDRMRGESSATIALPEPVAAPRAGDEAGPAPMPQVQPVAAPPPVSISRPASPAPAGRSAQSRRSSAGAARKSTSGSAGASSSTSEKKAQAQELWPANQSDGAAGRAVRIGTFSSRLQAKRGWRAIVRIYPGMGRLSAVVVPSPSLRNGRTYYRLQFGTTSQAHSAVLCQWMRSIGQSCVVIGQPQKSDS